MDRRARRFISTLGWTILFPCFTLYVTQRFSVGMTQTGLMGSCLVKLLVFTEGTIIQHGEAVGLSREQVVRQIQEGSVYAINYSAHVPVGNAVHKLNAWKRAGAEIAYLTSRTDPHQVQEIRSVLKQHGFPEGELFFRRQGEAYRDVAERVVPDILIEDDCESIGGEVEMTYPHMKPELKARIKSIVVKEFGGIDHLSDNLSELARY